MQPRVIREPGGLYASKVRGPVRKPLAFAPPHGQKKQLGVIGAPIGGDEKATLHFYINEVEAIPQLFFESFAQRLILRGELW